MPVGCAALVCAALVGKKTFVLGQCLVNFNLRVGPDQPDPRPSLNPNPHPNPDPSRGSSLAGAVTRLRRVFRWRLSNETFFRRTPASCTKFCANPSCTLFSGRAMPACPSKPRLRFVCLFVCLFVCGPLPAGGTSFPSTRYRIVRKTPLFAETNPLKTCLVSIGDLCLFFLFSPNDGRAQIHTDCFGASESFARGVFVRVGLT